MGPLLFLVYINDITKNLSPQTRSRLFADDGLMYRTILTVQDCLELQNDLKILEDWELINKMEFHPGKCQILRITNKLNPIIFDYSIHSTKCSSVKSAKYLGVNIDSSLQWTTHYNEIIKKANSKLSFLSRNLSSCPKSIKDLSYKSLVRPILEYGCCVWDPHYENHREEFEKVQKRAARFVLNRYDFTEGSTVRNFRELNWPTLAERRARIKLKILYKARNGSIHIPSDILKPVSSLTRRNHLHYTIPQSEVNSHLFSFYPITIRMWNSLPRHIKISTSLNSFEDAQKSKLPN